MIGKYKKKFLQICLLVLTGFICFHIAEKGKSEKAQSSLVVKDKEFILQKDRDQHGRFMNIIVRYPEIAGAEDLNLDEVNRLIREAAFSPLSNGKTVEETIDELEKEKEDLSTSYAWDIEYKILYLGDDTISLAFHMLFCVGGPSAETDYMVTLDIKNGRCVYFNDCADINQVLSAIVSGDFTVYKGTCFDVTDEYVHKPENCRKLATIFREKIYTGQTDGRFDRSNSQNIGIDEKNLYIYISVPDQEVVSSFHGYFILCIPMESVKASEKMTQTEEAAQHDEFEMYQILNDNLFGDGFLEDSKICEKEGKEDFSPKTDKDSSYPEELVIMAEKAFYDSDMAKIEEAGSPYQNMIEQMGGEEYQLDMEDLYLLFPKIAAYKEKIYSPGDAFFCMNEIYGTPFQCVCAFRISLEKGQDNYIFVCNGNDRGEINLIVTERKADAFEVLNEFEIPKSREGKIVCYEEEFFYIFLYRNFNQKDCDGFGICSLMDNPEKDILSIWYLPSMYEWKQLYTTDESPEVSGQLDVYIEQLKQDIKSGNYLDNGVQFKGMELYMGDEKEFEQISIKAKTQFPYVGEKTKREKEHDAVAYQVDAANCGLPVYVWKEHALSYMYEKPEYLRVCFYYYDSMTDSYVELSQLGMDEQGEDLVQMWFKEIEGKIYTFQIFYVSEYSYMLKVVLLEKNNVKTVRTYLLSPRREFIVEGSARDWIKCKGIY